MAFSVYPGRIKRNKKVAYCWWGNLLYGSCTQSQWDCRMPQY